MTMLNNFLYVYQRVLSWENNNNKNLDLLMIFCMFPGKPDQQIHSVFVAQSFFQRSCYVTPESGNSTTKHQGAWHFLIYL